MSDKAQHDEKKQEYWRSQIEDLQHDAVHGSVYLADRSLEIVEEFVRRQDYRNRTELIQSLSKLSNALIRAQPLMALIYNRVHHILDFIKDLPREERNIEIIRDQVVAEIGDIRQEGEKRQKAIIRLGARMILDQHTLLTHSSSYIVESILLEARRLKKRFQVICTESRPRLEGTALAGRLAKAGIKTTLIPDADITRAVDEANFVLTGTDRITENTFINKTGTGAIARIASAANKPFYVAGDTEKILLKRTYPVRFHSKAEHEVFEKSMDNLSVNNFYFEEIPLELVHKIVCETSIFERNEYVERFL